VNTFFVHLTLI